MAIYADVLCNHNGQCAMTSQFLQGFISLLCEPVADDLLVPNVPKQSNNERDKFNRTAKEWTQKYAQDQTSKETFRSC